MENEKFGFYIIVSSKMSVFGIYELREEAEIKLKEALKTSETYHLGTKYKIVEV